MSVSQASPGKQLKKISCRKERKIIIETFMETNPNFLQVLASRLSLFCVNGREGTCGQSVALKDTRSPFVASYVASWEKKGVR